MVANIPPGSEDLAEAILILQKQLKEQKAEIAELRKSIRSIDCRMTAVEHNRSEDARILTERLKDRR